MKKYILLIALSAVVFGVVAFAVGGQDTQKKKPLLLDGREELHQLYRHSQNDRVNVSGVILLLDAERQNSLKERTPFTFIRQGSHSCYAIGQIKTFVSDSFAVEVDTADRQLVVSPAAPGAAAALFPFEDLLADTSFRTTVLAEENDGLRTLTLQSEYYPGIKSCRIVYDPVSYAVRATEVEFWKDELGGAERLEQKKFWLAKISYAYAQEVPDLARMTDSILMIRNGHPEVGSAFKTYSLQTNF